MKNLLLILFLTLQTFALGNTVASAEGNTIQETEASRSVSTPVQAHDTEGNLTKKTSLEGDWLYQWYGNGMLKSVQRPDNKKVQFEYDALGRRTAKISDGNITKFVWDGNTPLHEWTYSEQDRPTTYIDPRGTLQTEGTEPTTDMTTWLFEAGSFVPAAKIINDKKYSIVCDYLGTPVQAYDSSGEKVWECALDIYGKAITVEGEQGFVPFRFQGQYEDCETGLCYNRFRYYSADSGTYISKDPIGLFSGEMNLYSYVNDSNSWVDPLGLSGEIVYQLLDANGNVNYYGITSRDALVRMKEHAGNGKVFSNMEILADGLSHDQARSIEGALIRKRMAERLSSLDRATLSIKKQLEKAGLDNLNRGRVKDRWLSDNPLDDLKDKMNKKPKKVSCG